MLDLSIIILNYNTQDWLQKCLKSIDAFPPEKISGEIIVVDNDSADGSVAMVKKEFPRVKILALNKNGGFAKGNNAGIQIAKGRYVMLLNSDTEFTSQTKIDKLVNYLDKHDEVGVITPRLQLVDGSLDLASHRGEPTPWAALTYFGKLERAFPNSKLFGKYHQTWQDFNSVHEIEACSGAAMMVRTSALKDVGLLDEQFFMYAEDLDWCRRFREAKYKVVFYPKSVIVHHKYKSGRGKAEVGDRRLENGEKKFAMRQYLQIPGIPNPSSNLLPAKAGQSPISNNAEHHFWETMNQYYDKHYAKSHIQKFLVKRGIKVMRKLKGK